MESTEETLAQVNGCLSNGKGVREHAASLSFEKLTLNIDGWPQNVLNLIMS